MSADWYCKIGDKKHGPFNGQQLKVIVAKGQLLPEHLVRRGTEGPWVPAGRVKGLFPDAPAAGAGQKASAKSPQAGRAPGGKPAAKPPTARATPLPTAEAAPQPPAADIPAEFALGGHKHHVNYTVDSLNIDAEPVMVSNRKTKGVAGLKKGEQKKLNIILLSGIGGGMLIFLIVLGWAIATGKFSSPEVAKADPEAEKKALEKKAEEEKKAAEEKKTEDEKKKSEAKWKKVPSSVVNGAVEVKALKWKSDAPPDGSKVDADENPKVLIVPINLKLAKDDAKDEVELTSWAANKKDVVLKDDANEKYDLLDVITVGGAVKAIAPGKTVHVQLLFPLPTKVNKYLRLDLPATVFGGEGRVPFQADATSLKDVIKADEPAPKAKKTTKADAEEEPADAAPKSVLKKKKLAQSDDAPAESTPKSTLKKKMAAKPVSTPDEDASTAPAPLTTKKAKRRPVDEAEGDPPPLNLEEK